MEEKEADLNQISLTVRSKVLTIDYQACALAKQACVQRHKGIAH